MYEVFLVDLGQSLEGVKASFSGIPGNFPFEQQEHYEGCLQQSKRSHLVFLKTKAIQSSRISLTSLSI